MKTLYEELFEVCKKHNTDFASAYWELAISDYLSCTGDFENDDITDDDIADAANRVCRNDELWDMIYDTFYNCLTHRKEMAE